MRLVLPATLTDDISYPSLYGHYGRPLPSEIEGLHNECIERGKDVVVLITAIKLKNHELEGIRKIQDKV